MFLAEIMRGFAKRIVGGKREKCSSECFGCVHRASDLAPVAFAHHGTANYDTTTKITEKGVVTGFDFVNPHVQISWDAKDASGAVQKWQGELTSPNHLLRAGWTKDSIKPGDAITVLGYGTRAVPTKFGFKKSLWAMVKPCRQAAGTSKFGRPESSAGGCPLRAASAPTADSVALPSIAWMNVLTLSRPVFAARSWRPTRAGAFEHLDCISTPAPCGTQRPFPESPADVVVDRARHDQERHERDFLVAVEDLLWIRFVDGVPRVEKESVVLHPGVALHFSAFLYRAIGSRLETASQRMPRWRRHAALRKWNGVVTWIVRAHAQQFLDLAAARTS